MTGKNQYREGHFMGIGMLIGIAIFMPFGFVIWVVTDNPGMIGIGPALGVAIGISIGTALEKKYNPNPRPLTIEEKRMIKMSVFAGVIMLLLGAVAFLWLLLW